MRKLLILIIFSISIFAKTLDIDIVSLEKAVKSNPSDIQNRLILIKYYLDKNETKAIKYIKEVLKVDKNNKFAKKFLFTIKYKNIDADKKIEKLYNKQKYKEIIKFFENYRKYQPISKLKDYTLLTIARIYMWEEKYKNSLYVLNFLKDKKNMEYYELKAYNYYYLGDLKKAKKYFKILYYSTGKSEYAKKLLDIYITNKDLENAKKLLLYLKRNNNQKIVKEYSKKLIKIKKEYIKKLYEKYKKNPSFKNLQPLFYALYNENKQKAYKLLEEYIKNNPTDKNAKLFFAKILTWDGESEKALKYLKELNSIEAKLLLGKIFAWNGEYKKAIIYLSDVYDNGNKKQKYEALKMLGFIAMWQGNKKKAKKIFLKLFKQNSKDIEVKEALMILNGNIKPLIKKYERLYLKNPNSEEIITKLADLYYQDKDYKKAAKFYEKYLKMHPEKIETYKILGDIYLILKNYYKAFGYLEYYAHIKNTKEAYLELAKRYYWNGFNKEALSVVNELLKKYPNYEDAILLKAKILKINPRFVNSSSVTTIDEFFNKKSKQLLIFGDRAYFNGFYATALDYYKSYLMLNPNDYNVREKYAYTLEYTSQYDKAAGEFFLLTWYKNDNFTKYHYAYNLQKSGKIEKAKKIYKEILSTLPKPLPKFLKEFLNRWKKAWESMDFKKYAAFYDKKIRNNIYWRIRKQNIFKNAWFISVGIYEPLLIKKEKNIYVVKFFQTYASKNKKDKGYKTLWIKCENKNCKIIKEKWSPGKYIPYNKNNSLEKYIKENLKLLEKKPKSIKSLYKKTSNIISPKTENLSKYLKSDLNSSVEIISKKKLHSEKEVLNYQFIKLTSISKKKIKSIIPSEYTFSNKNIRDSRKYKNHLTYTLDFFKDNQKTTMLTHYLKYTRDFNKFKLFGFYRWYRLSEKNDKIKGNYKGIGIIKNRFIFDIFKDNSGINTIGWDFSYQFPYFLFNLNRHNLVYSRKNICSSKHMRLKAEITDYKEKNHKELWYSIAYEKIDDGNNAITPQVEKDLYYNKPINIYFAGWYQFNSKENKCYYSPKKTDNNIIGIKYNNLISKHMHLFTKAGIGYSFFDKTKLYEIGGWINSINFNSFYAKAGCKYSNSSKNFSSNSYNYYECTLHIGKDW